MKRILMATMLLAAAAVGGACRCEAGSYLFERSYYSHTPEHPVQIGHRAPTGGPQFTRPQGVAATSGLRRQYTQTRVAGQVVDQLNLWDTWVQFYGKY